MLIEFSVGNFRSFKDPVTLSMVATNTRARDPEVNLNNTIEVSPDLTLLTSAGVYGANASGKSNLAAAMEFMKQVVITSSKESQAQDVIPVQPFLLSTETEGKPSFFQMVFLVDGIQYRYGFEVTQEKVVSEWLFHNQTQKEARLFIREGQEFRLARDFKEGRNLTDKTRPNALFLSVVAQFNGPISTKLLGWFQSIGFVSGQEDDRYRLYTFQQLMDGIYKNDIVKLVKSLDLDIADIQGTTIDKSQINLYPFMSESVKKLVNNLSQGAGLLTVQTQHKKYDAEGKPISSVTFDIDENESHGTQKLLNLAGPIIDVLTRGLLLVIDELEALLHPNLTQALIQLFNSKETNPKRAQLIFTTHDTNLLSNKLFRRDQIWFVEKDKFGASHLYSLAELKVRNDASFEDDYVQGKYGAVPFLGDLRRVIREE